MFFGYFVALPFLFSHILMCFTMAQQNPVNQHYGIRLMYFADVLDAITLSISGVRNAIQARNTPDDDERRKTEYKNLHKVKMAFVYIKTTFGSGAIRLTVWLLWLIGKFFS